MRYRFFLAAALACAAIVPACTSVHSNLTINGKLFGPDQCRNLQDEEIFGVDLKDENGTTLRFATNADNSITVVVFPNDGTKPLAMTGCSKLNLDRSGNDKYGHYTLDGDASLDCQSTEWTIQGSTSFDECGHDF
jgi:hypothetical protein